MGDQFPNSRQTRSDTLHPLVYRLIVGLAVVFVLATWAFLDRGGLHMALYVVTLFVFVAVAIPWIIGRIWQRYHSPRTPKPETPAIRFLDWARGEFGSYTGTVKARLAVIEVLLPIVVAVLGLMALVIIRDIAVG